MSPKRTFRIGWRIGLATLGLALAASAPGQSRAATLTTLASFDGADGSGPMGLIVDPAGNLFGTTTGGGLDNGGTVFEIAKTQTGYADTPKVLVSFCSRADCADGSNPTGLIIDAAGNLLGTRGEGGTSNSGTVFEIPKTAAGYANHPTVLVSFSCSPSSCASGISPVGLIADAHGNLFGSTTLGGANHNGTVFEVASTAAGYAHTAAVVANFCNLPNCADEAGPAGLAFDTTGNLFGATQQGGTQDDGAVFEIAKTAGGYAQTPTVLVSFCSLANCADGEFPQGLIVDAHGNLFGVTLNGGAHGGETGGGTVFEIVKTAGGYAHTPTVLANFCSLADCADGSFPNGPIEDAAGNLFGTTQIGGVNRGGTVFEIAKTAGGYAATPTILVNLCSLASCADGDRPLAGLIADAHGNLFGTTSQGGANERGTVFEVTGSGFVVAGAFAGTPGAPSCHGKSVAALAKKYSGLSAAATALGYSGVPALQHAIAVYCAG